MSAEKDLRAREEIYTRSLDQVSTVDGRDAPFTREIAPILSEGAFHRYRAIIEVEALIALSESDFPGKPEIDEMTKSNLRGLTSPDVFDPKIVTEYDHIGRLKDGQEEEQRKYPTEHDVKSVELYLGELFDASGNGHLKEWIHFAVTSEDINNVALNLMFRDAINEAWLPQAVGIMDRLALLAEEHKDTPVLGRTHYQAASPTTYGKRFSEHLEKMMKEVEEMGKVRLGAKFSGAVGNNNAISVLAPDFDYRAFSRDFVERFGFTYLETTNQTNNHIDIVDFLHQIKTMNTIAVSLAENVGLYILQDHVFLAPRPGQIGSSVMAHKAPNPWRFETGRGTLDKSSNLINGAADGLIKTDLERDSHDHAWERGYGEMLGMSLAGLAYIADDLAQVRIDTEITEAELERHYEIFAEAIQLALRMEGNPGSYMQIKDATQGKRLNRTQYQDLVMSTIQDPEKRQALLTLRPRDYVGDAPKNAQEAAIRYRELRQKVERGILDDAHAIDAVLFDFDNTLQFGDKEELAARMKEISLRMGLFFSDEEIIEIGNRSDWKEMVKIMARMHSEKSSENPITEEEIEAVNKEVSGTLDHYFTLSEDTVEMLETLKKSGKKMGIVTTRRINSLMRSLKRYDIEKYFDVIITRDNVDRRKPHPEPIAKALELLGIAASDRVLYVGDKQEDDIIAGNALGLKTALITEEEIDPYGAKPTYKLKRLRDITNRFGR